jgi:hypothetical protein
MNLAHFGNDTRQFIARRLTKQRCRHAELARKETGQHHHRCGEYSLRASYDKTDMGSIDHRGLVESRFCPEPFTATERAERERLYRSAKDFHPKQMNRRDAYRQSRTSLEGGMGATFFPAPTNMCCGTVSFWDGGAPELNSRRMRETRRELTRYSGSGPNGQASASGSSGHQGTTSQRSLDG